MTAKAKVTYTAEHPTTGETLTMTTARQIAFFTFGYRDGTSADDNGKVGWTWLGVSSASDEKKARAAGRSTNPYFAEYKAVPAVRQEG